MFQKSGFDSQKYIREQTKAVQSRVKKFKRLYLEFGGKLCYDNHASRVLPGYKKTNKIKILQKLGKLKIIYCINSKDLQSGRLVGKSKYTYEKQILKDLKDLKKFGFENITIVVTRFKNENKSIVFSKKISRNFNVYFHKDFRGYTNSPKNAIKSFEIQKYIPIKENLIVMTGPAGNSGKMATALCQIYKESLPEKLNKSYKFFSNDSFVRERRMSAKSRQSFENQKFSTESCKEQKMKISSGFAKFETFPIWNLPVNHPINLAYESATADLQDEVVVDPYHKKFHKKIVVNYNRDINNFGILQEICRIITKQKFPFGYKSPTDMGINAAKSAIINDGICQRASIKEIFRRQKFYLKQYKKGKENIRTVKRMEEIVKKL
ncbi:MAG: DUF1846 family protein [Nanoarchaeota archaeon]|nr:DUF1846 family protein [Nanoarchaeota archaeon]